MATESRGPIIASIAANVAIAITKFIVAGLSRSTAMLAEAVHSLVNCFDGILLLFGQHRSRRPPDAGHPFGHGREQYFWALIVAVLFFALGSGFSIYEGIARTADPEPLRDPTWNYIVIAVAALFDGTSFVIAFRQFQRHAHGRSFWKTIRQSKDPALFSVVLEDTADLVGLAIAFIAIYLAHRLGDPVIDGIGSIAIGLVLGAVAIVLLIETHSLLIGEAAGPRLVQGVRRILQEAPEVVSAEDPDTVQLGPDDVVVALRVRFADGTSAEHAGDVMRRLEKQIKLEHPEVKRVMLEPPAPLPPPAPPQSPPSS